MAQQDKRKRSSGRPRLQFKQKGTRAERKSLGQELKSREMSRLSGRLGIYRSQLLYRVYSLVPARYRWMLPWLQDYLPEWGETDEVTEATVDEATVDGLSDVADDFLLPALAKDTEIIGQRGRYRIEALLGVRGRGRVYRARQLGESRSVCVREYLLSPQQFSAAEIRQRQNNFRSRGGLALADGRPERFRLVTPLDTIPDQKEPRCYLITPGEADSRLTLRHNLQQKGAWSESQVWRFFDQTLQTLESLHSQKFILPNGNISQGLVHNNLSLDSLLIEPFEESAFASNPQFLIYITDLSLWEDLFNLPGRSSPTGSVADDLAAIARISYQLLTGKALDTALSSSATSASPHSVQQPRKLRNDPHNLDPHNPLDWPEVTPALKQFALQLLGVQTPFASAAIARAALSKQRQLYDRPQPAAIEAAAESSPASSRQWWKWGVALLLLGSVSGGLGWWLTRRNFAIATADKDPQLCCLAAAVGVPRGQFTYASDREGIGADILHQKSLVLADTRVETELEARYRDLKLTYQPADSDGQAVSAVESADVDFALSTVYGQSEAAIMRLPAGLHASPIAHDAIAVFVAFNYEQRAQGLPHQLNGKLTIEQLRQIYTGQVLNWKELGGPDLPIKLYIPAEPDKIAIFERRVLQDDSSIAEFRALFSASAFSAASSDSEELNSEHSIRNQEATLPEASQLPTIEVLRSVIQDFEESNIGSIGFGAFSQVFGQCSVYPLALKGESGSFEQAIVRDSDGKAIDPQIDLCQDKGSYHQDERSILMGQYPLSYPLEVIYPYDNSRVPIGRKIAEALQSQESQRLLKRAGLVPINLE